LNSSDTFIEYRTVHIELDGAGPLLPAVQNDAEQVHPAVHQRQAPELQGAGSLVQGHPVGVGLLDDVAGGGVAGDAVPFEAPGHGDERVGGRLQRGAEMDRPAHGATERARGQDALPHTHPWKTKGPEGGGEGDAEEAGPHLYDSHTGAIHSVIEWHVCSDPSYCAGNLAIRKLIFY